LTRFLKSAYTEKVMDQITITKTDATTELFNIYYGSENRFLDPGYRHEHRRS